METPVIPLNVKFKKPPPEGLTLIRDWGKCSHGQFLVDESKAEVECGKCGEKLNPMWVLARLAGDDTKFHEAAKRYQEEMKRLNERSTTKCNYCGKMTRISHR